MAPLLFRGLLFLFIPTSVAELGRLHLKILDYFCSERALNTNINYVANGLSSEKQDQDFSNLLASLDGGGCSGRPLGIFSLQNSNYSYQDRGCVNIIRGKEDLIQTGIPGILNRDVWVLPTNFLLTEDADSLRLDSQVFTYNSSCEETSCGTTISETYSVLGQKTVSQRLGTLSAMASVPPPSIWQRRADLKGVTLNVLSLPHKPYAELEMFNQTHAASVKGFYFDMVRLFQMVMGFEAIYQKQRHGLWGTNNVSSLQMDSYKSRKRISFQH